MSAPYFPLSSQQREIWFSQSKYSQVPLYNIGGYARLGAELDPDLFARAVNLLVQKHDILRTVLTEQTGEDGLPLQTVLPHLEIELPVRDFSTEAAALEWMRARFLELFTLSGQPLFRYDLVRTGECYDWLMQYHHIIADGYTLALLHNSLAEIYSALARGETPDLTAPAYADYVEYERGHLSTEVFEAERRYWRKQYPSAPAPLFNSRYRPESQPIRQAQGKSDLVESVYDPLYLPRAFARQLEEIAKQHRTTLPTLLLCALYVYFSRVSRTEEVSIGWPVLNRQNAAFKKTAGIFISLLPVPLRLDASASFMDVLRQVSKILKDVYRHQSMPLSLLKREIGLDKTGDLRLFDVSLSYMGFSYDHKFGGVPSHVTLLWQKWEQIPLIIHVQDFHAQADIVLDFLYNLAYFEAAEIRAMHSHFMELLRAVAENPATPLSELRLVPEAECRQMQAWNETATDYPRDNTLTGLFAAQVEQTPETIAVESAGRQVSYRQLHEQSNTLARRLQTLGVKPQDAVALCAKHTLERALGLLAILKAGAAYLPIDPDLPQSRIAFMCQDAGVAVALMGNEAREKMPAGLALLEIEGETGKDVIPQRDNIPSRAEDLAYLCYTSGSTGTPKGACIPHRAVIRLVKNNRFLQIVPEDRVAQASNIAFDAATFEIWGALLNGARLIETPKEIALSASALKQHLDATGINTLFLTTALFNQMARFAPDCFANLKHVLFGGEAVDPKAVASILAHGRPQRLLHVYGPTENTTFSTWYPVEQVEPGATTVPIGYPLSNDRVFILDARNQPVPIGAPGELCLAGDGLARGYLNAPALTAEKFIEIKLFGKTERVYKTGDLARFRPDGAIEYIGRLDHQIKLRGFRIELGEIEAALLRHPQVKEAVVTFSASAHTGDKRLIAYAVLRPEAHNEDLQASSTEFIQDWKSLYDNIVYRQAEDDLDFNLAGWLSSYTGEPIPREQMRVWVDSTVASILSLSPRDALELGCGSGLLLARVAPHTRSYLGTDFSAAVLQQIEALKQHRPDLAHVQTSARMADDFSGLHNRQFDTVILNSVSQYFPSVEYFISVLEQGIAAIKPGGHFFIGDIRHFGLLRAFHVSVQTWQAAGNMSLATLRQRIAQQQLNDKELLIDPRLFIALAARNPRVSGVRIVPHRGLAHNELTRFRYQAILEIEHPHQDCQSFKDWQSSGQYTLDDIRRLLAEKPAVLGLRQVANLRLAEENAISEWLDNAAPSATVEELRQSLATRPLSGLHPEALWQLGEELGYAVDIGWHNASPQGDFDALFTRLEDAASTGSATALPLPEPVEGSSAGAARFPLPDIAFKSWHEYANNPLQHQLAERWIPRLREHLNASLPDYMIPSAFVLLDALPLNANGKIDRKALPDPEAAAQVGLAEYVAPRTPEEETLARIWAETLGLAQVGIHDNFFDLGGDSLSVVQLLVKVENAFGVKAALPEVFDAPSVAQFAASLPRLRQAPPPVAPPEPISRDQPVPLTFFQEWFWRHSATQPDSVTEPVEVTESGSKSSHLFNAIMLARLSGEVNHTCLQASLAELAQRHELLRATFHEQDGEAVQVFHAAFRPDLQFVEASTSATQGAAGQSETEVNEWLRGFMRQPFALEQAPPWRAALIHLADNDWLLAVCMHHVLYDARSAKLFFSELQALYAARAQGKPSSLPPLPLQYADYAYWERRVLAPQVENDCLAYWRDWFARGLPQPLPTPSFDKLRASHSGAAGDFRAAALPCALPPAVLRALREPLHQAQATLPLAVAAGLAAFLAQEAGIECCAISLPFADGTYSFQNKLFGPTGHALILRLEAGGDPSFTELLARARAVFLAAYSGQYLPIQEGMRKLGIPSQPGQAPFHLMLSYLPLAIADKPAHGGACPFRISEATGFFSGEPTLLPPYGLVLHEHATPEGVALQGTWLYRTSLFSASTIQDLVQRFERFMAAAAKSPEQPLSQLRNQG